MDKVVKIDVIRCFRALIGKWYLILGCSIIGALVGYMIKMNDTPVFYASASIYSASYGDYQQSLQGYNALINFAELANSSKVINRASDLLNNEISGRSIMSMVSVSYNTKSILLLISAKSSNPQTSIKVANAVAESFIIEAQNIIGGDYIKILDEASYASIQGENKKFKYAILGLIAMSIVSVVIILIKEIWSDSIYHVEDASLNGELEIFGMIPEENSEVK